MKTILSTLDTLCASNLSSLDKAFLNVFYRLHVSREKCDYNKIYKAKLKSLQNHNDTLRI